MIGICRKSSRATVTVATRGKIRQGIIPSVDAKTRSKSPLSAGKLALGRKNGKDVVFD